jgi:phage terminase large subunit GpA-like protein
MTPAAEQLRGFVRGLYAPADRRGVVEWCEDELYLSERQSQMPGKFSTRLTPYMREPLAAFGDSDVSDIIFCWASQTGKTTVIQAGVAWRIANKPAPVVWVMPNEKLAKSFSETRWMPICEDSPTMREHMPKDRNKWSKLEQHFDRCSLVFVGSNSPANLASRPAGLLLMDEVDKFASETDRETSALLLAENRTKSFAGALRVKTSTPTTPEGEIWQEYLKGSCEKFLLPCPHCQERVELLFDQVKWDQSAKDEEGKWNMAKVADTARYECQKCAGQWTDGQKIEALSGGQWMATNHLAPPGVRSFHLSSIYAPWKSCSFGALAVKFLRDKESINGLRDFVNSTKAEPWVEPGAEIALSDIDKRKSDYEIGQVLLPEGQGFLLCGLDVQQAFTNYVVRAFAENGESWLVDYGRAATPEDAVVVLSGMEWGGRKIDSGMMDSGYMTERVYAACIAANQAGITIFPSKGGAEKFSSRPVRFVDFNIGGRTLGRSLAIYSDEIFKRFLYLDSIRDGRGPWHIPRNVGRDYTDEMLRERLVPQKTPRGYEELIWKRMGPNHYADAEKLCLVRWHASQNL